MTEHAASESSRLAPSIFNDVLGPVMRGPSSSHTAGSYHLARLAAALLGTRPARARVAFDGDGSYGRVYQQQGVDRAFATGFLGWPLTDARFHRSLEMAPSEGLDLAFEVRPLPWADHPNAAEIVLEGEAGARTAVRGKSIGGGAVVITEVDGWSVSLTGQRHTALLEFPSHLEAAVKGLLAKLVGVGAPVLEEAGKGEQRLVAVAAGPLPADMRRALSALGAGVRLREVPPVAFANVGQPLFASARAMVEAAEASGASLGRMALAYESQLLALPEGDLLREMVRRLEIMREAVAGGLTADGGGRLQLLAPAAPQIMRAEAAGRLAVGGLHTRAAARAMAVMHVNGGMGVVCAAPTGGSAGVLPGVLVTLAEERGLGDEDAAMALFAAGAVGVVVAARATFAAEVAGCQVEIGAAGAMAAAAVVEAAGGGARQAADAAAVAFQNTMGSVCDLVQGMVEIPCHTRNAAAASGAFVCADLLMGGYANPIPLDETIDAVFAVGKMLPPELRCTAKGGLAITLSALRLGPSRKP